MIPRQEPPVEVTAPASVREVERWQLWLVLVSLFVGVFVIALTPVADGDIFWHVAAGREMVARRAWLRTDPFTLSALGRPWIDVHWLFQLAAYAVYRAWGLAGLVIGKAALVATGAVVLARLPAVGRSGHSGQDELPSESAKLRRRDHTAVSACALALLVALFLARHQLPPRPTIVTLLMLALFLAVLESARRGRRWALLWLPPLQLIWANCQGLSAFGPALVAAYLLAACLAARGQSPPSAQDGNPGRVPIPSREEFRAVKPPSTSDDGKLPRRQLALALALCCCALLVTPYGRQAAFFPAELLRRVTPTAGNVFSAEIAENLTPWSLARVAPAETAHLWWYLAALALCLLLVAKLVARAAWLTPSRALSRSLSRFVVLGGFVALALMANRNVVLLYWVATPLAISLLTEAAEAADRVLVGKTGLGKTAQRARWWARWVAIAGAHPRLTRLVLPSLLAGSVALAVIAHFAAEEGALTAPAAFHFPVESVKELQRQGASGAIFAPDHQAGFIELTVPALKPYLDTRLVLHTGDEYAAYLAAVDAPAAFDALDAREAFRYVVLTTSYPDRYLGLARHLASSPGWKLIFTDGTEVLFAREGDALDLAARPVTSRILSTLAVRFNDDPRIHEAARLNLARFLVALNETREAQFVLQTLYSRAAAQLRARNYFVAGERAAAESMARTLIASDARDLRSLTLLARLAIAAGDRRGGGGWLRQAFDVDPYDPEARQLLEQLDPTTAL